MNVPETLQTLTEKQRSLLKARLYAKSHSSGESPDHKQLVAYVRYKTKRTPLSREEIDALLSSRLPSHMLPSIIRQIQSFPLNSTGKVDRKALAEKKLDPESYGMSKTIRAEATTAQQSLLEIWKSLLGNPDIGPHDNFFKVGGDSILAIRVVTKARQAGINLQVADIFKNPTIATLAPEKVTSAKEVIEDLPEGPLHLLPIQEWLLGHEGLNPNHWNQSALFIASKDLTVSHAREAVELLWERHDGLRLMMHPHPSGWFARIQDLDEKRALFHCLELEPQDQVEFEQSLGDFATDLHRSIQLESGNLFQGAWIEHAGNGESYILLVANHMVVDGVSWRIIVDDLEVACQSLVSGQPLLLPEKTASVRRWSEAIRTYAKSDAILRHAAFWRNQDYDRCRPIPQDFPNAEQGTERDAVIHELKFASGETEAIRKVAMEDETGMPGLILTAYLEGLRKWTGQSAHTIHLEGHGREELDTPVDLSRTVGWLTSVYPVVFDLSHCHTLEASARETQNILRKVPKRGFDYSTMRYLLAGKKGFEFMEQTPPLQLVFNYLGIQETVSKHLRKTTPVAWSVGEERDPRSILTSLIEMNCFIDEGHLKVCLKYSGRQFKSSTLQALLDAIRKNLLKLGVSERFHGSGSENPPAFKDSGLDDNDLNSLFSQIN